MDPARPIPLKKRHVAANASAKSTDKPKRPLSAFNLFYRFKRQKVLTAILQGDAKKEDITRLVEAAPGLEDHPSKNATQEDLSVLRRNTIRKDLEHSLLPRDTRDRDHRTNESAMNGTMSFLELARLMNVSWKGCDDFAKGVFKELSDESRALYRERLAEYNSSSEGMRMKEAARIAKAKAKAESSPAKRQGGPKSNQKKRARRASSKTDEDAPEDDGSSTNITVVARMDHLRQHESHASAPSPSLLQSLAGRDLRGAGAQATRTAVRAVSNDRSPPQEIEQPLSNEARRNDLMLRVRELEGQLEAERLKSRVRELEGLLARQKTVEDQLRMQVAAISSAGRVRELENLLGRQRTVEDQLMSRLMASSHPGGRSPGATGGLVANAQQEGLSALVNASIIHPSLGASERANELSRMVAARHHNHASALRPFSHVMPMNYSADDAAPNKKQCND